MIVVFFFYGLAFVVLGGAIALRVRKDSEFHLSESMPFLAGFGLLHGANEWMDMFALLGSDYWTPAGMTVLRVGAYCLGAASFVCLAEFGLVAMMPDSAIRRRSNAVVAAVVLVVSAAAVWNGITATTQVLVRYCIGLPGALLAKLGCRVDVAANGEEALEMVELLPYDVVFMDCEMPVLNGFAATTEIRRRERGEHHLPIVAMTARALEQDRERCLQAGMDDYISKPVRVDLLRQTLDRWAPIDTTPSSAHGDAT
jgi:CheY-like chemotaxis protein